MCEEDRCADKGLILDSPCTVLVAEANPETDIVLEVQHLFKQSEIQGHQVLRTHDGKITRKEGKKSDNSRERIIKKKQKV